LIDLAHTAVVVLLADAIGARMNSIRDRKALSPFTISIY
jgi:hypothetical protein